MRLGDVARVELGAESAAVLSRYNGQPSAALAVRLATGANALTTIQGVWAYIDSIKGAFPEGLKVVDPYDTTPFVRIPTSSFRISSKPSGPPRSSAFSVNWTNAASIRSRRRTP